MYSWVVGVEREIILLYPLWVSIPTPPYLDLSDHKGSPDITQRISEQGKEDVYDVKYIHNTQFSLFKKLWSKEKNANQTL